MMTQNSCCYPKSVLESSSLSPGYPQEFLPEVFSESSEQFQLIQALWKLSSEQSCAYVPVISKTLEHIETFNTNYKVVS